MPKVSILLPFYQAARTLESAVWSLLEQTFADWELLLLDDGSMDHGTYHAAGFASRDPRVVMQRLPHTGIVQTLNVGLDLARAPLVARMDADDICLPDRLAEQVGYLDGNGHVGMVSCLVEHLGKGDKQQGYANHVEWTNSLVTSEEIALGRFVESPFAHPSVMFRKELVQKHGGYRDGNFPEDYELWLRWMDAGVVMGKVPKVLLRWRDLPDRLSRNDARYRLEAFYRMKFEYLAKVLPQGKPIWIWGAGRTTRHRATWLQELGVRIEGYYDVDPKKTGDPRIGLVVKGHEEIEEPGDRFILVLAGARGIRQQIRGFLAGRGWMEGKDFLFGA
jgi:glycosyltransferase involved in cell wall biosynthesis